MVTFLAIDLHYWQTDDLEWYDPGQAITENGSLAITLETTTDANSHGLGYLVSLTHLLAGSLRGQGLTFRYSKGGMIQSWNKANIDFFGLLRSSADNFGPVLLHGRAD